MAAEFKELNGGSIVCGELLGLRKRQDTESPEPSDRTPEYYKKRPCPQIIYNSALIVARNLLGGNRLPADRFHRNDYSRSLESMMMVTGPSFTSSTCMSAPNTPLRTCAPLSCSSSRQKRS